LIVAAIAAFNEEKTIAKIIARAMRHVDGVIVIDDGSTDDTAMIAKQLGAQVFSHEKNKGYGAAISSCFSMARDLGADVLVTLDGDGQHDPEQIPKVIEPILDGQADVVIGSRFHEGSNREIPRYRLAGMRILNAATNRVSKQRITDSQSGFRSYSKKAIDSIKIYETGMGATSEIAVRADDAGLTIAEVPISVAYAGLESSSKNPLTHGLEVLSTILRIAGEKHPVLFFGVPGLLSILAGLGGWVWVANRFAEVRELPLGMALVSTVLLITGVVSTITAIILYTIANASRRFQ
jgi:glycosyltransferase involved in cell wall biosynthesis